MKETLDKTAAIIGMACRFTHMPNLSDYWYYCVNGSIRYPYASGGQTTSSASNILTDTIKNAAQDAHLLSDKGCLKDTVCLICHNSPVRQEDKDQVKLILKCGDDALLWIEADRFKSLRIFEKTLSVLWENRWKFAILAVISDSPIPECAAIVFSQKQDKFLKNAYAIIHSLVRLGQKTLIKGLDDLSDKGLGYIGVFSKEDHYTTEVKTKPSLGKPIKGQKARLPYGVLPISENRSAPICIMAGMLQMIMSVNSKIILPSADLPSIFEKNNPGYYQNFEVRPWIQDTRIKGRQCAVVEPVLSNQIALVVLEEVCSRDSGNGFLPQKIRTELKTECELIVFSSIQKADLVSQIETLLPFLELNVVSLTDIAGFFALQFNASHPYRLAIVANDIRHLKNLLNSSLNKLTLDWPDFSIEEDIYFTSNGERKAEKMACLFPGLGFPGLLGAYSEHLMDLCLHFPEFRQVFDDIDLRDRHPEDPIPTHQLFFPPTAFTNEDRKTLRKRLASPRIEDYSEIVEPSKRNLSSFGVCISNWAGWQLFQKLNIVPDVLFGQSLGELSALCAGNAINFDDLMDIYWKISLDPEQYSNKGRLALVGTNENNLAPVLQNYRDVSIAIHVGQDFQILGGDAAQLNLLTAKLKEAGVWTQLLPYAAIHTPNLTALRPIMEPYLMDLDIRPFHLPVYSGMTCNIYPEDEGRIRTMMVDNIDHPVLLWQTTRKIYADGARILVQVGGGATMYSQAKTNIGKEDLTALTIDVDYRSAWRQLNHLSAGLLEKGVDVHFQHLFEYRSVKTQEIEAFYNSVEGCNAVGESQMQMPFIGKIMDYHEKEDLVIERKIDLTVDAFLRDHVFVNASSVKPVSSCLPVVPMTVSTEMMAEAAACLTPGCGLIGFENVRASQWIGLLDKSAITVKIVARCAGMNKETGIYQIWSAIYLEDNKNPAIEGTVLMAENYIENLVLDFTPIDEDFQYPLKPAEIYGERHLFHGPAFQCITGEVAISGNKVIGELVVLPKSGMFSFQKHPDVLTDPALLDGVGQLVGLWSIDQGEYVFPIGLEKLEIYCPTPPVGTKVPVLVEIKSHSTKLLAADIEIQDGYGNVWMRIKNWKDWVFRWSKSLYDFRRQPEYYLTSQILSAPDIPGDAVMQYISMAEIKDMDIDTLARFFSHESEMAYLNCIPERTRQWQWLLTRIVGKDALRRWMAEGSNKMMHPANMVLEDLSKDRYRLKHPWKGARSSIVRVSSSQKGALALVSSIDHDLDLDRVLAIIESSSDSEEKRHLSWL